MIERQSISQIKNFILDLIFPKFCLGCGLEGDWLCRECKKLILPVKTQVCPDCGKVSRFGRFCQKHKKTGGLSGIIVASYYNEGPIKELIHNFKYNHILELKDLLAQFLIMALKENRQIGENLLLTAVPLHFLRRAQRGYNQTEVLAGIVAEHLKIKKNFQLINKFRYTQPQVKTGAKKRRKNLQNSFKICKKIDLRGKIIILVDDVTTTGTTLNECARVLRLAGAARVWGLVVAKG